ncbi:MAG: nickel-dependent hydrogenase large subunit [bacterium]
MAERVIIDPLTRIEGHLKVEVEVDGGRVGKAFCSGTMFRGFEVLLRGRHPFDSQRIVQRICGVCHEVHGMAAAFAMEEAFGVAPPPNGRVIRNLISGASFLQSHILHFYQLSVPDYADFAAVAQYRGRDPDLRHIRDWVKEGMRGGGVAPFLPRYRGDYIEDEDTNIELVHHYLRALEARRLCSEMIAIFGGKAPFSQSIVPGGITERPTIDKITRFMFTLKSVRAFIDDAYVPDAMSLAGLYPQYFRVGRGPRNLMTYGAFPLGDSGRRWISPGVYLNGADGGLDFNLIAEGVRHSWYRGDPKGVSPRQGRTEPDARKEGAYSWIKSPRYGGAVMEVGPLARMFIHRREDDRLIGAIRSLGQNPKEAPFSVMGRHLARALEAQKVASALEEWISQVELEKPVHTHVEVVDGEGVGATDAPRGALLHYHSVSGGKTSNYQVVSPTTWNLSPRDDRGQPGAVEQALQEERVEDPDNPIEVGRIVRSFDPCLACSIHVIEAKA